MILSRRLPLDTGTLHHNYEHPTVSHSNRQYLDGLAHTNQIQELASLYPRITGQGLIFAIKSFWAKANMAKQTIIDRMKTIARNLIGKQLTYQQLTS